MNERVVCGLANKCAEATCRHRLPHDRNLLCDDPCDMSPERKGCIGFAEYMTKIKLKGGKNIEPYNGGLPVKILRKEVMKMHYKDGSPAYVGDVLKTVEGKIGTVASIQPGSNTCNAQVAVTKVFTPQTVYYQADVKVIQASEGLRFVGLDIITVTLGECEKVA